MTAIKEFLKSHANKSVVAVTAGVSLAVLLSLGSLMVAGGSDAPEGAPGETGAPGPAGGTGPAGPVGETGSAGADMLGELSCTGSKVVINDNGWRCADPVLTRSFAGVMNYNIRREGNGGLYTSVAIGTDDNPVISHTIYYDNAPPVSALYVCDDPTCTTGINRTIVTAHYMDYPEKVGGHRSIAIGVDGNPVISHAANEVSIDPTLNVAIAVFAVIDIAFE